MPDELSPGALTPPFEAGRDHWRGGTAAMATVLVFGDFQCPYTRMAERSIARLRGDYGESLRRALRHLPLTDIHPRALAAAVLAEAAGAHDRFWEMHDLLFENQEALSDDDLSRYAADLAVDVGLADTDAIGTRLEADYRSAVASGARGTPTIFINAQLHDAGYEPKVLASALERAGASKPEGD